MEEQSSQPALRVCPRCAVASRTEAESCPNCGRRYRRRRWPLLAVGIVIAAFAIGYGGRLLLADEGSGDAAEITLEQARAVAPGTSREELRQLLGNAPPAAVETRPDEAECLFYPVTELPDAAWEFCFIDKSLVSSKEVPEKVPRDAAAR